MATADLFAWKFLIPPEQWIPLVDNPAVKVAGCLAVAVAETAEAARESLERYGNEMGYDTRWLLVARVVRLNLTPGATLGWAQS